MGLRLLSVFYLFTQTLSIVPNWNEDVLYADVKFLFILTTKRKNLICFFLRTQQMYAGYMLDRSYMHMKGVRFGALICIGVTRSADIISRIGEEKTIYYCLLQNIDN